jgi:hypothetical protein
MVLSKTVLSRIDFRAKISLDERIVRQNHLEHNDSVRSHSYCSYSLSRPLPLPPPPPPPPPSPMCWHKWIIGSGHGRWRGTGETRSEQGIYTLCLDVLRDSLLTLQVCARAREDRNRDTPVTDSTHLNTPLQQLTVHSVTALSHCTDSYTLLH